MADARVQLEVEDWVRRNWMPTQYGTKFSRERLRLRSGGVFDFDAVSEDHSIVATISTSGSRTSGGKSAVGKILKLRSDMLFLTMVDAKRRIIVLTERDMCDQCEKEFAGGRVPPEIEFVCAVIPDELRTRLEIARQKASAEAAGR
jgi:bifunctional DNA-binding transcriptional regulator/antitoxin component of YhaV-PrlF toxin-antitoxin module